MNGHPQKYRNNLSVIMKPLSPRGVAYLRKIQYVLRTLVFGTIACYQLSLLRRCTWMQVASHGSSFSPPGSTQSRPSRGWKTTTSSSNNSSNGFSHRFSPASPPAGHPLLLLLPILSFSDWLLQFPRSTWSKEASTCSKCCCRRLSQT